MAERGDALRLAELTALIQADAFERVIAARGRVRVAGATLDDAGLVRLGQSLGALLLPSPQNRSPVTPELTYITESTRDLGVCWHTDYAFLERPPRFTVLLCREAPSRGGETEFIDTRAPCRELPPRLRARLEGATGLFSFSRVFASKLRRRGMTLTDAQRRVPDALHPIMKRHPITGESTLHLHEQYLLELRARACSRTLLEQLYAHVTRPRYVSRHRWRAGDLIIWDNRSMLHRGPRARALGPRRLARCVVR